MPKARLEFTLPEEQEEFDAAVNVGKYQSALNDIYNFLRADSKYGVGKYQDVYDKFWDIMQEHDIDPV